MILSWKYNNNNIYILQLGCYPVAVPINETSEQNSNGYCNVEFVFTLDPTNASFICGIKVIFSIMNLYLFLNCVTSDLRSVSSLWFDMRSICYLLYNNMHIKLERVRTQTQLCQLTLNPLTWRVWWAPNNASKWQMGFNSAFKGLMCI